MEPQRPFLLDRRGPARLDDGGRKRVDDDRGAGDGAAGREVGALVERDSMLGAREPGGDGFGFGFTRGGGGGQRRGSIARFGQFDADAVDDEARVRGVSETLAERGGRGRRARGGGGGRGGGPGERRVGKG